MIGSALNTLAAIMRGVAADDSASRNALTLVLDAIAAPLSDVDSRMFQPAVGVAVKSAEASQLAATLIPAQCLPPLLAQLTNMTKDHQVQHATLLDTIAQLIFIAGRFDAPIDAKLQDSAQAAFISAIGESVTGHAKLINAGLSALDLCVDKVGEVQRASLYAAINRFLTAVKPLPIAEETVIDIDVVPTLSTFATAHQDEVLTQIVQPLLERNYFTQELTLGVTSDIFEALGALVHIHKFREAVLTFMFKVIFDGIDSNTAANGLHLDVRLIGLRGLSHLLDSDHNEQLADELNRQYNVFDRILTLIHSDVLTIAQPTNTAEKTIDDMLYEISQILRSIVRALDVDTQRAVIGKYLPIVNLALKSDLYFATGLLGYLEQTIDLEDHFEHLVDELTQMSLNNTDEEITNLSNRLLCSLFNKCPDNDRHRSVLRKVIDLIKLEIENHNKKAVEVLSWISKGLLVRGHTDAAELIDTVRSLM